MKIYSFPTFNLMKLLLTAEELEVDYQLVLLDAGAKEHKSPEHLQRHPLGKVPTLELNGRHYFESNSICRLLAEYHHNRLYADTPEGRAVINQWIDCVSTTVGPSLVTHIFEQQMKPKVMGQQTDTEAIATAQRALDNQLPVLESRLSNNSFLAGDALSIADTIAFSYCQIHEFTSVSFEDYPALLEWYQHIKSRPAFSRAMAQLPGGKILRFL